MITHPFSASIKNKEIREIVSKILEKKGEEAISNLNSQIDDMITECLGFLASEHIDNDEVKYALMCVILHKLISIYEPIMKASEKKSPLFFWEIKSILPNRL
jgi:hypothetical protein